MMINKKALFVFLAITFGVTLTLIITARLLGFTLFGAPLLYSQLMILGAMFVPAIAAIITQKWVVKKPLKELGFKLGSWKMYAKVYGLILLVFILNYAITWVFILKPDFTLQNFMTQYGIKTGLPMPAWQMILVFTFVTLITAPLFNLIPSLGEEIGWRGFLLPTLEPLGQTRAMIISGVIWALWHTPMILILGFGYGAQAWPGVILHFILVTSLGIWMGFIWFKTRSTILAGFIHAVFNGHAYGVCSMLFISSNKLIIGAAGLIGTMLMALLGLLTLYCQTRKLRTRGS
jgi:membrane protease YdiL (CAAX protease family)